MAPLKILIRTNASDSFELETDDEETVETLTVLIYSLRPDLGQDSRLVHKGIILKAPQLIRDLGIKSGDAVVVARMPQKIIVEETPMQSQTTVCEVLNSQDDQQQKPSTEPSNSDPNRTSDREGVQPTKQEEHSSTLKDDSCPTTTEVSVVEVAASSTPLSPETLLMPVEGQVASSGTDDRDAPMDVPAESSPAEKVVSGDTPKGLKRLRDDFAELQPSAALMALAARLEGGNLEVHPSELVDMLRHTANRVEAIESAMNDSCQALMLVNHLSARVLQGLNEGGHQLPAPASSKPTEDSTRSFLIKKGDVELQESHRATAAMKLTQSNVSCGGTLSASSVPKSKEELDRAREARLQRLEALQADKKKEQEDAAAKAKSKEAMFQAPSVGLSKPLGRF
jgi:hypothetical protein